MATISAVLDALKTRLETISGLRAHDTVPGQVNPPAAVIEWTSTDYDQAMGRGLDRHTYTVRVLVSAQADAQSQDALHAYVAPSGSSSVKAAVEGGSPARTLGGTVQTVRVTGAGRPGVYEHAGHKFLGVEWDVEIYDSGV